MEGGYWKTSKTENTGVHTQKVFMVEEWSNRRPTVVSAGLTMIGAEFLGLRDVPCLVIVLEVLHLC